MKIEYKFLENFKTIGETDGVIIGGKYRHFKGHIVKVIGVATHSETIEKMVVYIHDQNLWVRPLEIFKSKVDKEKYPNSEQEYRFELITDNEEGEFKNDI